MKTSGIVFWIIAGILLIWGLVYDVSVEVSLPTLDTNIYGSPSGPTSSNIVNLQALQTQMMLWEAGLAAFIGGGVLFGFGSYAELRGLVVREQPITNADAVEGESIACEWCGISVRAPAVPCPSHSTQALQDFIRNDQIQSERCKSEIAQHSVEA